MDAHEVITRYYDYANAGDWQRWCDLFAEDQVMDEQLAGHIEGLAKLRSMMTGMGDMYEKFSNRPVHVVVDADGERAAVVSHLSAVARASGKGIEAEVMNFFRITDGKITYMANFHDTVPFRVLSQAA
ncbi:nuclear transport factor 2 family protein [Streptomyces sp. NPDC086080]|uniref:nuclear transport factor 2 family protein n=1 Tax=Streptomyces sp. NPDC086080 TaxID=3365748 RepID=UPI0037CEE523